MKQILQKFSLEGKNALVVNPERMYGFEIVKGFLEAGARVWLAGADVSYYEQMKLPISGIFHYKPGTEKQADLLLHSVKEEMEQIDILVENSLLKGVNGWKQTAAQIYEQLEQTQLASMFNVQKLGRVMAKRGEGSVLLVSDYGALVGYDLQNYEECSEKQEEKFSLARGFMQGGFVNYARQAAGYLGEHGCRCNCIAFGPLAEDDKTDSTQTSFEKAYIRHSHIKRLLSPEDIATTAVFLSSDAASYITGITLPVDGGYTAK